jgi:hypothetical protein
MRVLLPVAQALLTLPRATNSVVGGINAGAERRQASDVYTRFGGRRIPDSCLAPRTCAAIWLLEPTPKRHCGPNLGVHVRAGGQRGPGTAWFASQTR